jgi:FtsP/CotA-like multicopper oxidase with cupredoxin domain
MRAITTRKITAIAAVALAASTMVSSASAATPSFELCAVAGNAQVTSTTTVPIWGFAVPTTPGDCTTATADIPGPTLVVTAGDAVTIIVHNALPAPAGAHTIDLEIPGISLDPSSTASADPGSDATVTFTANAAGTYLYQSGGGSGRQLAMGLSGALIVRPSVATQAYDDASTAFTVESTLVLSQVDPVFNASPDTADMYAYDATYWLINGEAAPDADSIAAGAGQTLLIRYLNAGYDNTSMSLLGAHERVIAKDAGLLANPFLADADTIPAGATEDVLITVPSTAPPSANGFPLFNRNLHLSNGASTDLGGMLTFIVP